MLEYKIPLIIRGEVFEDHMVRFEPRRGQIAFLTPDVKQYFDKLVMRNPSDMADLYSITIDDIIDFLSELSERVSPANNEHIRLAIEIGQASNVHSRKMLDGMYDAMAYRLKRPSLEQIVEQNFGRACLEGWEKRTLSDRDVMVRAYGARTVHINAGNGPLGIIFALVFGSLLRCDNIIKSPSNDAYTSTAFALTMMEMAPDHPLTKHLSVAYWQGGDAAFEKKFYKPQFVEKIIAWGGVNSMQHIRGYLAPGMDLVALDPKISSSIIGKEAFDTPETLQYVADRLAVDVGSFNQAGCSCARTVYVESGTSAEGVAQLNKLGGMVYDSIQKLPDSLSTEHPAFDPVLRSEIDGIRYSDAFKVIGGKGAEGAVIVSQESECVDFSPRLDCRVINMVPVDDVTEAYKWVTIETQTIGIYPESLKEKIADQCALRGAQKLTTLGCAGSGDAMAHPHDGIEWGRMARWVIIDTPNKESVEHGLGFTRNLAAA